MDGNINSSDVGVGSEDTASIGTNVETEVSTDVNQLSEPTNDATKTETADDIQVQMQKAVEEANESDSNLVKHLRGLVKHKLDGFNKPAEPTFTDDQKFAIELYEGLNAFDNEKMSVTARPFAERLVQKDADLAYRAVADVMFQPIPNDPNGWSFGHKFLADNGIDPTRLDDVRAFLNGEIGQAETRVSYSEVPDFVPKDMADAFKASSPELRSKLQYDLEYGDDGEKRAALEILQAKQYQIDTRTAREQAETEQRQRLHNEIQAEAQKQFVETFDKFVDSFRETPTFKTATLSSDPTFDSAIKDSINLMVINLADPDSVAGRQSLKFFQNLGVQVNTSEIQNLINIAETAIAQSVGAGKVGANPAKAQADSQQMQSIQKLSAIRNAIFAQAVKFLASAQQKASQQSAANIDSNGGIPTLNGGSFSQNGQGQESVAQMIERLTREAQAN